GLGFEGDDFLLVLSKDLGVGERGQGRDLRTQGISLGSGFVCQFPSPNGLQTLLLRRQLRQGTDVAAHLFDRLQALVFRSDTRRYWSAETAGEHDEAADRERGLDQCLLLVVPAGMAVFL